MGQYLNWLIAKDLGLVDEDEEYLKVPEPLKELKETIPKPPAPPDEIKELFLKKK